MFVARYSFCVKKKNAPKEYLYLKGNYDLPFLTYFAAQFNNKNELLNFLGLSSNEFDSIEIRYQENSTSKFLPIYFDAPILAKISEAMLDFKAFEECGNVYEKIALAYRYPEMLKTLRDVPNTNETNIIIYKTLEGTKPNSSLINNEALYHYLKYHDELCQIDASSDFHCNKFFKQLKRSYIQIYKAYIHLRTNDLIKPQLVSHQIPNYNMEDIVSSYGKSEFAIMYELLESLNLTEYEKILVDNIINGSESAYEELKSSDSATLERLMPLIRQLDRIRGKQKK